MSAPSSPELLALLVHKQRAHPEYLAFQEMLGIRGPVIALPQSINSWDLIADAVDGTGGFADGGYLVPHELELDTTVINGTLWNRKFLERQTLSRYDNFAKVICDAPWNSIVQLKDTIVRTTDHARLAEFWDNADGNGTSITDFLEYPEGQCRRYGTAWIVMDRTPEIQTLAQDLAAAPYVYPVPTRNVVWWEYDQTGKLVALVYKTPNEEGRGDDAPLMVWTQITWSIWIKETSDPNGYRKVFQGFNSLGEIPAVPLFDERPGPGRAMGKSNLFTTARFSQDVYNRDSEIREIERHCAFPVLGVSVENMADAKQIEIGTTGVIASTGKYAPAWVEPILNSIDKLAAERAAAKEAAFAMSEMGAFIGHTGTIQTSSGFHAEVEQDKSERKVARHSASLETTENKLARMFLAFVGEADTAYEITYPRRFGLADPDKVIQRTQQRLNLGLGNEHDMEVLRDYYAALYPRKTKEEIEELATSGVASKEQARKAAEAAATGAPAQPDRGRFQKLIRGNSAAA